MPRQPKKRKTTYTEDIDFTVSDLEDDRVPVKYVVEKMSKDQRRVLKADVGHVSVSETEAHGSGSHSANAAPADTIDEQFFEWDLGNIDVEALRSSTSRRDTKESSSRRRYISSVNHFKFFSRAWVDTIGRRRMSR